MSFLKKVLICLPEVAKPTQRKLSFKEKLKWTGICLLIFFVLGLMPLYGLGQNSLEQFEFLSIILGASFGSIISLGIGPLVTASIVLQLLNGAGILKFDLTTHEGKQTFQGVQKLFSIFFVLFESVIFVYLGGLAPDVALQGTSIYATMRIVLVFQLVLGGILIMFMDEVVAKWGFGSGISLFIAAGVSQSIFIQAFAWYSGSQASSAGFTYSAGAIPALVQALMQGDPQTALIKLGTLVSTVLVFIVAVYVQSMKVEIPLSFGRIRGQGIRWPLSFIYTSNIPVILVSALIANVQLWARLVESWVGHPTLLGGFSGGQPTSGLVAWLFAPNLVEKSIIGSLSSVDIGQAATYTLFMILGSVVFSIFWVQTAGMDAESQAKQMMSSGLQIPGFRKDQRVLERVLNRYIWPLTIMGAVAVGFISSMADLSGALSRGTGILLTVMIVYKLYEDISRQHMMDMNPMMRKFMGG